MSVLQGNSGESRLKKNNLSGAKFTPATTFFCRSSMEAVAPAVHCWAAANGLQVLLPRLIAAGYDALLVIAAIDDRSPHSQHPHSNIL